MGFGNYKIVFGAKGTATLAEVFGTEPIGPAEMNKKLWAYIKANNLSNKEAKTAVV